MRYAIAIIAGVALLATSAYADDGCAPSGYTWTSPDGHHSGTHYGYNEGRHGGFHYGDYTNPYTGNHQYGPHWGSHDGGNYSVHGGHHYGAPGEHHDPYGYSYRPRWWR